MDIVKMIVIGLLGATAILIVKEYKPQLMIPISIATVTILFWMVLSQISYVLDVISAVVTRIDINSEYILAIIKIIGISYLAQFGAEICRDAGQQAIASKIELGGKLIIVVISIPILIALMNLLIGIIP